MLAILVAWFETAALPPPPFRTAPWVEIAEPAAWRAVMLCTLRAGLAAGGHWDTTLLQLRWLAKQITPPDIQAAAHIDDLVERQGPAF